MSKIRFLGLDVHADTIAVAVAEPNGEVRSIGCFPEPLGDRFGSSLQSSVLSSSFEPVMKPDRPAMFCTGN